ncbi:MAG: hypothetical protein JXA42_09690 [Anaerolineales bacterium]|nr:hypothetical protein [Anaerolineales bacterium]
MSRIGNSKGGKKTSRELMLDAMLGNPTERIPCMPQICTDLAIRIYEQDNPGDWIDGLRRSLNDPDWAYEQVIRLVEDIDCDGVRIFVNTAPGKIVRKGDELYVLDESDDCQIGKINVMGGGGFIPDKQLPPIQTLGDAKKRLNEMVQAFSPEKMAWLKEMREKLPDRFVASKPGCVTINTYIELRGGPEKAMMDFFERPDFVSSVMEMQAEAIIERGERLLPTGIDALYIEDAYASLLGPKHLKKFCMPSLQLFCKHFEESGIPIYIHVCGNVNPILEMLAETGVQAVEPLDPLGGVSVADAKDRIGDRVTIMGGLSTNMLRWGTPAEVKTEAVQKCREGGPFNYILAAGCSVPPETSLKNLRAMVDVAKKSQWKRDIF